MHLKTGHLWLPPAGSPDPESYAGLELCQKTQQSICKTALLQAQAGPCPPGDSSLAWEAELKEAMSSSSVLGDSRCGGSKHGVPYVKSEMGACLINVTCLRKEDGSLWPMGALLQLWCLVDHSRPSPLYLPDTSDNRRGRAMPLAPPVPKPPV